MHFKHLDAYLQKMGTCSAHCCRLPAWPLCLSAKNADKAQFLICKKWPYLGHFLPSLGLHGRDLPFKASTSPISRPKRRNKPHVAAYLEKIGPYSGPITHFTYSTKAPLAQRANSLSVKNGPIAGHLLPLTVATASIFKHLADKTAIKHPMGPLGPT